MNLQPFTDSPKKSNDGMMLSPEDVERLLRDDSPDSRSSVLEKVAVHYNDKTLTPSEQEVAEHIFRLLMKDVSTRVRQTLSEHMKANEQIPRDIVLHLAQDTETVAMPVLENSKVLSDADLVSIVESSHDTGKLMAITRRETVSPRVSDALVSTQYSQVVRSLLSNPQASISDNGLSKIVANFSENPEIVQALAAHPNLPVTVVERLISKASEQVASQLKEKYKLTDADISQGSAKVREEYMMRLLEGELSQEEIEGLVAQMAADGSLAASTLMTSLCRGQLAFFTVAIATMSNIPLPNAQKLLADRGEHGFRGLYKKSGLPESMMEAVRFVLRAVQNLDGDEALPGSMFYASRLVDRILEAAGEQNIEYLPYFIAIIRQNAHRK